MRHCAHDDLGLVLTGRGDGSGLTAAGRAAAAAVADRLPPLGIVAIHASPRLRAQQTAAIVGARLGLPVETVDALDEIDFGAWTGRRFDALADDPAWQQWNGQRSTARTPGGETMAAGVARAFAHVEAVAAAHPGRAVLCVSHADVIRGVVARVLGLGLDDLLRFDIDPGSVSTLVVGGWGGRVAGLNRMHACTA